MATRADIRRAALALPQAHEVLTKHGAWCNVGTKTFVVHWAKEGSWIFKLPKPRQEFLFEVRPDVFTPYRAGAMVWSIVDIAALERGEAKHLVTEAWTTIVPKKLSRTIVG